MDETSPAPRPVSHFWVVEVGNSGFGRNGAGISGEAAKEGVDSWFCFDPL
jgi:hypothetical protein